MIYNTITPNEKLSNEIRSNTNYLAKVTQNITTLSANKLTGLGEAFFTAASVTIPADVTVDVSVTCTPPTGCSGNPIFGYVKSTGWAGLIPQGTSRVGNKITVTIYNASGTSRTVAPIIGAIFARYS